MKILAEQAGRRTGRYHGNVRGCFPEGNHRGHDPEIRCSNLEPDQTFSPSQLIALTFVGLILAGALLLMLPIASTDGSSLSFVDALFTATSASCVTGLVVVDTGNVFFLCSGSW